VTLVLDARQPGKPGIHALICGVSRYRHLGDGGGDAAEKTFGLKQLSSTATTALLFYRWLRRADAEGRLPLPLATVHMSLSPTDEELTRLTELPAGTSAATRASFVADAKGWRAAAGTSDQEMTFFYFAGHGVQRKQKDAVLLFADFADPAAGGPLVNTADVNQLIAGMAPPSNNAKRIARQQVYFVDACRMPVNEFRHDEWAHPADLWSSFDLPGPDNRVAPVFYSSIPGSSAFAAERAQTLFSVALFECLDRRGASPPPAADEDQRWRVSTFSLISSLDQAISEVNARSGAEQDFAPDGQNPRALTLSYLTAPPNVDVSLRIEPAAAAPLFRVGVTGDDGSSAHEIGDHEPHPWSFQLPAGVYSFSADLRDPPHATFRNRRKLRAVELPRCLVTVEVES
jgi:hypothetical protein